jgi:hypothetical protein
MARRGVEVSKGIPSDVAALAKNGMMCTGSGNSTSSARRC